MRFGWLTLAHSPSARADYAAIDDLLVQACLAEDGRLRRRLAHRAQLHRRGGLLRSHPVRERARRAHLARADRLRGDPARAPPSDPARRAARAARQPEPRAPRRGRRPRLALQRVRVRRATGSAATTAASAAAEALEILTRAWTEEPFAYHGKYYQMSLPALRPRVYQRPHPPIWRSVVTPGSFAECGRLGVPIMTSRHAARRAPGALQALRRRAGRGRAPSRTASGCSATSRCGATSTSRRARRRPRTSWPTPLAHTRRHMLHARAAHNPEDYRVDPAVVNAFNDPRVSEDEAMRFVDGHRRALRHRPTASPSRWRSCATPASTTCSAR